MIDRGSVKAGETRGIRVVSSKQIWDVQDESLGTELSFLRGIMLGVLSSF